MTDREQELLAALKAVQHNRLCSCYAHGGPCARCVVGYDEVADAIASADASASRAVSLTPSEIRDGEDNDGPLQSTDLFLRGRGISLLVNVPAGSVAHYSMRVDKGEPQSGTVGASRPDQQAVTLPPRDSNYYAQAVDLCADELMKLKPEHLDERRHKIVAILRHAALAFNENLPDQQAEHEPNCESRTCSVCKQWFRHAATVNSHIHQPFPCNCRLAALSPQPR